MTEEDRVPGFWRLLWLLFMQPLTLHRALQEAGIEADASGWDLWKAGHGPQRTYLLAMAAILVTVTPAGAGLSAAALEAFGAKITFTEVITSGAVGIIEGVAWGVIVGVTFGVGSSVAAGIGFTFTLVFSAAKSASFVGSIGLGAAFGIVCGITGRVAKGVTLGIAESFLLGVVGTVAGGILGGVNGGVVGGIAIILLFLRIPLFFVEASLQGALFAFEKLFGAPTLHLAPVFHHELSYIPHPFLQSHLLLVSEKDSALVHRTLDACSITPGQRSISRKVLARLQARELAKAAREQRFERIVELDGEWLAGREGADPLLLGFAEAARYLASARAASIAYHRRQKLGLAREQLRRLKIELWSPTLLARFLSEALPIWEQVTQELSRDAERAAANQIPHPFRAGEPLSPEEGSDTFRGREELIHSFEALLGEPGRGCSIALLGPRRCGKTSLLKMLPLMLPDAVCVLFDLQDNPIDSPASFFPALERRAREQARRDRQLDLPRLPAGSPFEAGSRWIESLDEWAGDRRILLCIDEFERLESLFPGSRRELLQLLGLLRATIQHRRRIRLLVSGAAPFDELDALWNDHLINAREVRIGYLDESTAVDLLRKPIDEFPDDAVPEEVARTIFDRTGGQPFLVQLYGSVLISRLNREDRRQAQLEDVPKVEEEALPQATYYLRGTWQTAPAPAKDALLDLAFDREPQLDADTRRWLRRRLLLDEENRLSVPAFGAWLRGEEAG